MQPGLRILKKTTATCHVAVTVIFLSTMQYGCGSHDSADKQKTSAMDGKDNMVLSSEAGSTINLHAAEKKFGMPQ
ncbi:MAG TPA: hypothetical protein VJ508_04250, partial [Saprospiraceae bacterium]|nr:hypothetical protein [Saprospiraceae bacterium]